MRDVLAAPRAEVVDADDAVPVRQQAVYQRRSDETGCPRHQCAHRLTIPTAASRRLGPYVSTRDELGRPHRCRADRGAAGRPGGAGVRRLLLLGRPDPDRPGGHPGPAVAGVPVRRPRRPRHAGRVPGGGRHHPAGAVELDRAGDQPGRAAAAGVAGAAAGAARDPGLAAGAAAAVDVRAVHSAGCARLRVVGGGAELAADAGRAGVGVRRRDPAGAHRQPALCGHRVCWCTSAGCCSSRRRPSSRSSRSRSRRCWPMSRHGFADDGVAPRDSAVGGVAGGDGRVDRRVPGRRRSEAVELRSGDDVGPAEPLGDARHRAGSGWGAVGLATLGARLAVGHAARRR